MVKRFVRWLIARLVRYIPQDFTPERIQTHDYKAEKAREILDNPLMGEIFERIENQLVVMWKSTHPSESEVRDFAYYRLESLHKVRNMIKGYLNESLYEKHLATLQSQEEEQGG